MNKLPIKLISLTIVILMSQFQQKVWAASVNHLDCNLLVFTENENAGVSTLHAELLNVLLDKGYNVFEQDLTWSRFLSQKAQALAFFSQPNTLYVIENSGNIFRGSDCLVYFGDQVVCRYSAQIKSTDGRSISRIGYSLSETKHFYNNPVNHFYKNVRSQWVNIPNCVKEN